MEKRRPDSLVGRRFEEFGRASLTTSEYTPRVWPRQLARLFLCPLMAAPKGTYTPSRGPLAGRTFALRPGESATSTAPYTRYQGARAQALGFRSYQAERVIKRDPMFQALFQRAVASGAPRNRSISQVGQFMRQNPSRGGMRKHNAIKLAIDSGWVTNYDIDDDDWAPY